MGKNALNPQTYGEQPAWSPNNKTKKLHYHEIFGELPWVINFGFSAFVEAFL